MRLTPRARRTIVAALELFILNWKSQRTQAAETDQHTWDNDISYAEALIRMLKAK